MTIVVRPCWVRFARDFDYLPSRYGGRVCIAYKAGRAVFVTRECAERALSTGAAVPAERPTRVVVTDDLPAVHRSGDSDP